MAEYNSGEYTCFDCKFAKVNSGSWGSRLDPPEPPSFDCESPNMLPQEVVDWLDGKGEYANTPAEDVATVCPCFLPVATGKCSECHREILHPKVLWSIWVQTAYEEVPTCSESCRVKAQEKADKEIKELSDNGKEGD